MKKLILFSSLIITLYLGYILYMDINYDNEQIQEVDIKRTTKNVYFDDLIEKPSWFEDTETIEVNSSEEVTKLWQSEKRCCENKYTLNKNFRIFYKACYNAIVNNPYDEDLIVKCLWLMGFEETKSTNILLDKYVYENYFHHENRIDNCYNCSIADTVARVTSGYAYALAKTDLKEAISVLEKIIDERESDISNWIKIDLYNQLSNFYLKQENVLIEQKERIANAVILLEEKLKTDNEKRSIEILYRLKNQLQEK